MKGRTYLSNAPKSELERTCQLVQVQIESNVLTGVARPVKSAPISPRRPRLPKSTVFFSGDNAPQNSLVCSEAAISWRRDLRLTRRYIVKDIIKLESVVSCLFVDRSTCKQCVRLAECYPE